MKLTTWVDLSREVEVNIGADDIREALTESFSMVKDGTRYDVTVALNNIGTFLNALTDEQIALLALGQRSTIEAFLRKNAERFKVPEKFT